MELFKSKEVFTQKMSVFVYFLYFFCLNEKELNQQACAIKYAENEISNSTSHKKKTERSKSISNFKNFNSKTPEKFSLVTLVPLVTNFHKF